MNDIFDIFSILCVVSLSTGLALFIRWIVSFIKLRFSTFHSPHKKYCRYIEGFCISFSFSIASLAIILISTPWQAISDAFTRLDNLYYIVLFFFVFVVVLFFRILAPIVLGVYILYAVVFALLFLHSYSSSSKSFDIQITEPSSVVVHGVSISLKNLLPLPRDWISHPIVQAASETDAAELLLFAPSMGLFKENSVFTSVIVSLSSLIIDSNSNIESFKVIFDESTNFPVQHTIEFSIEKEGIIAEVF